MNVDAYLNYKVQGSIGMKTFGINHCKEKKKLKILTERKQFSRIFFGF